MVSILDSVGVEPHHHKVLSSSAFLVIGTGNWNLSRTQDALGIKFQGRRVLGEQQLVFVGPCAKKRTM